MDELTLFRATHEDVESLDLPALTVGHQRLLAQIEKRGRRLSVRRRRRVVRRVGYISLGTGVLAAALILSNVVGPAGLRGGADVAAADVLHAAAAKTITTTDPVVGAGQYLVIHTTAVNSPSGETADHHVANYQERDESTLYIPADQSGEWVWVHDKPTVEKTFGPVSAEVADDWIDGIRAHNGTKPEVLRAAKGAFYGSPAQYTPTKFDRLPRDPRMLLNYIYRVTLGAGPSADGEALVYIADALRSGVVPARVRAALYEAAALIPGVSVTQDQATLDGHTGIAIGRYEPGWKARQDIIIDPDTGLMIGEREISYATDWDIPPGTASRWTAVTTTVEDSAPTTTTTDGE